jgi:hypothetical protein
VNGFRGKTSKKMIAERNEAIAPAREHALAEAKLELEKRAIVQAWIGDAILGDVALGRNGMNFTVPPEEAVSQAARRALKERGIVCYAGAGNYFQADLTGQHPRVIQRRPLAQRFVVLTPEGKA